MDRDIMSYFIAGCFMSVGAIFLLFMKFEKSKKIYQIIRILIVFFIFCFITVPIVLDFSKALNADYNRIEGIVIRGTGSKEQIRNYLKIEDVETGKKITVIVSQLNIVEGSEVTVDYLPVTKFGKVTKIEEAKKQDINKSGTNQTEHFEKMEEIFREIEQPIKQIVSRIKDNDSKELLFSFSFAYEDNYPKDEIVFMNGEVVEIGDSSKMEIFQSILGLEDAARELNEKKIIQHVTVKVEEGKNYDIRFYIDPALTPFITDNEGSPNSIVYLERKDGIFDHEKFDYHIVESNWYLRITPPRDE